MPVVLLADKVSDKAVEMLREEGMEVLNKPGLSPEELKEVVKGVDGVICRSGVNITAGVLEAADRLKAVCRAGVGVDNIDISAASRKGVVVMNTPGANTISTAEHTIALMLALARNVGPAYISMREGKWDRKKFTGAELCGTVLGIIGLGRVGREVARRATAFQMEVLGYDPFISSEIAEQSGIKLIEELESLLRSCDYLTVHIPATSDTKGLVGRKEIALMKPQARIINCARGEVVDMEAVVEAVKKGNLAGGGFDVYENEPPGDFSFALNDKILSTPHLGASTEAAQIAVGMQAAAQMVDGLKKKTYRNALNITPVPQEEMKRLRPFCELARKLGHSAGVLNRGRVKSVKVLCRGEVAQDNARPVENSAIIGVLQTMVGDEVNMVNAPYLARERGIEFGSSCTNDTKGGFTNLVELKLETEEGVLEISGTLLGKLHQRIIRVNRYDTEIVPEGELLFVFGEDKPGLIGRIGEKLGGKGINIARMTFAREAAGGGALLVLNLDSRCEDDTISELEASDGVRRAVPVTI